MIEKLGKFQFKTEALFGRGAIRALGELATSMGKNRCLLVADPGVRDHGLLQPAKASIEQAGLQYSEFTDVEPEPFLDGADQAAAIGRELGADLVIGIGGGSAMDTAKAAAALITNEGSAGDYLGLGLVPKPGVQTIMVPTTAGTGAEVTFTAVFTNRQTKAKGGINSPYLFPDKALLDPELTLTVPPGVTAATGMDALTHAVESFTGRASSVFTESLALTAIRLISENLRQVVFNGDDVDAREHMLLGSLLAGMALADAGVGAAHALAYPLGGHYRIPHGLANACLIPHVMEFNLPANPKRFAAIARSMGESTAGLSDRKAGELAVRAVAALSEDIGIPKTLAELSIPKSDIPMLVEDALKVTRPVENNPRSLDTEGALGIYHRAHG